ncbi:MAG: hypothetical protein R3B46_11370 [Phycisphaerales bacterium]|nr:hypothetical protein [Phycisphaerales bacterium]
MTLRADLELYDGKRTDILERIAAAHPVTAPLARQLIKTASDDDPRTQSGATWLILHHARAGYAYTPAATRELLTLIGDDLHWEPTLNLLQTLPHLAIGDAPLPALRKSLKRLIKHDNKLVRAWAYNGFAVLARQHPKLASEAERMLTQGEQDEAASVRARVRNARKGK